MSPRQLETAKEWLRRAKSNYKRALLPKTEGIYWEDMCFDTQQASEKALKALFIVYGKKFPYTHDIGELIAELEGFIDDVPEAVRNASELTDYAVATRYPGWGKAVSEEEYKKAVVQAKTVLDWIDSKFTSIPGKT